MHQQMIEQIQAQVQSLGYSVLNIPGENGEEVIHSVGLASHHGCDFIVSGVPSGIAHWMIRRIHESFSTFNIPVNGPLFVQGLFSQPYPVAIAFSDPSLLGDNANIVPQITGESNPLMAQVIVPDENYRFPWERGYCIDSMYMQQLFVESETLAKIKSGMVLMPSYNLKQVNASPQCQTH